VKRQLTYEKLNDGTGRQFSDLSEKDQMKLIKQRLKSYSNSVYKKTKVRTIIFYNVGKLVFVYSFFIVSQCLFV
jgi:hypothetical protein